ncbi:MAG: hypothetical protein R3F55_20725 [Alphaproteobacteria bacterium]
MNGISRTRIDLRALMASTALGAALCALGGGAGQAATLEEAETLRGEVASFLADTGIPAWSFRSGTVTADIDGDGYRIVIPDLVLVFDEAGNHAEVELDDVTLQLDPDPVDDAVFGVSARLGGSSLLGGGPVQLVINGTEGQRAFIDIGSHDFSGTWSSEISYFTDAKIALDNVVVTPDASVANAPDFRLSVGSIHGGSSLTEVEPGLWDGTGESVIEDVVVEADGQTPFRLDRFTLNQSVAGFAFADYMEWVRSNPAMMGEEPQFASDEEAQAFFKQTILNFPTVLDDFDLSWTLTGLDAGDRDDRLLIDSHEFGISATGLAGDVSDWQLRLGLTGLTIPGDEAPAQFVPTVVDIDLALNDLPTGLGWQAMESAVGGAEIRDMDMIGPMLGQQILQLALQAQSGVDLGGHVDFQTGNVTFDGEIHADPNSPVMASGGLLIAVSQMQDFIREVENTMGPESAAPLTMLQALGQQEDGANGPQTVFDFQISGSSVLMNGQDMQPLMMMLGQQ